MESNFHLDSLREISESQLEALLRYDSPPETPIQPTDHVLSCRDSIQEDLNKTNSNVEAESMNCINEQNREQFVSQIDSQIDFSVFHHYSPNIQWSLSSLNNETSENDCSILIPSLPNVVEISDYDEFNLDDETFMGFRKNEIISDTKPCNLIEKNREESVSKINCFHSKEYDFEEVSKIFTKSDYMSNVEESDMNKCNSSNYIHRKCQTQLDLKSDLKNSPDKITFSCPVQMGQHSILACSSTHSKKLYKNISTDISTVKVFVDSDQIKLNCLNLFDISQADEENENNHRKNYMLEVDGKYKEPDSGHIFGYPSSSQSQSQAKIETDALRFFDDNFSKEKNQLHTTENSTNANMVVDISSIPFSVRQLYDIVKTNYSDFAFIYALSSQLCQDRVPMDCFLTLKMALLLSLVSIENNENRPPIPIVAITNDAYMTEYLMTNIGQLGSRFLGPVDNAKSVSNGNWIEADSILLARGGVYYAGDWTRLKLRRAETIFKNIECSNVAVEKSTLSFPLETAIWTHWRSFKYGAKDQQMFNKFIKIFGIPIFVSDDNHESLLEYTLEQSSIRIFESTVDHLSVNEDDMRNFLVYVSQSKVDLSPEAALLLKNYFVASRSIRQECLSKQSYTMLKQFAESFAKLSMRKVVLTDDVLAAIIMCEHFIENVFGTNENSPPHFGNFTFVGSVDKYKIQFKEWLDLYIERFISE